MEENILKLLTLDLVLYSIIILMYFYQPKDINPIIGYRTKRSMKNTKSWFFAQKYFFKRWFILIIPITLISQIPIIFYPNLYLIHITAFEALAIIISGIYMTEKKLKQMGK